MPLIAGRQSFAQSVDAAEAPSFASVGIGAFLPLEQSYRINYSTSVAGIPIELDGDLLLPITNSLLFDIGIGYIRRSANFISDTHISSVDLEPGVRVFLESQRPQDFRIFALAGVVIARTVVTGTIDATSDGTDPRSESISRTYLPIGGAVGLGLSYPLSEHSSLDGTARTSVFFGSPSTSGGLGNIGGVALILQYRFAL